MADRTSAEICKRVITLLDTYDITPEQVEEMLEIFQDYDFNLCQAFWTEDDMNLVVKYGICFLCDAMHLDGVMCEEELDDNYRA